VFAGTFTAGDLQVEVEDGRLRLLADRGPMKFVTRVEQRTFSGAEARRRARPALYITERCVFCLGDEGLELIEVAPGIDLERDILARMQFRPLIRRDPVLMDAAIFAEEAMALRERMLAIPLASRFAYDDQQNILFMVLPTFVGVDSWRFTHCGRSV
jgi:propionate CoA-transferase